MSPQPRRVRVIGIGPGDPDQITVEAVAALRSVAYFVVPDKGAEGAEDPLVQARERLLAAHLSEPPALVRVADPARERSLARTQGSTEYERAVEDWHEARAVAYEQALETNPGDAGFLVWGDPAFYDSTIRILDRVRDRGRIGFELDVIPGVSSLQLLAARHRIVLHEIGQPLHLTTGRRLPEAVAAGEANIAVMLNRSLELTGLEDWWIWWGANLGTPSEVLVSGTVGEVHARIGEARRRARESAGWVMDLFLLRRPA